MEINPVKINNKKPTKLDFSGNLPVKKASKFYKTSSLIEQNTVWNRAIVDMFGAVVPWAIMANNSDERREKIIRFTAGFIIPYLTPFVTLPLANRSALKLGKVIKNFSANEARIIRISNKYLKDKDSLKKGLEKLNLSLKEKGKEFDLESIINSKHIKGDYEKLRLALIKAKNQVLSSDIVFTAGSLGSASWLTNEITKMLTGRTGFAAEYKMADKEIIEKRAAKHNKNKKKKLLTTIGLIGLASIAFPMAVSRGLKKNVQKGLLGWFNKNASKFDYNQSIYMKRLPFFIMVTFGALPGSLLATRNEAEFKDVALRLGAGEALFFGGDLVLATLFAKILSKGFGFKMHDKQGKRKSLEDLSQSLSKAKKSKASKETINNLRKSKIAGVSIFWTNVILVCAALGFGLPYILNKMTKKDVDKDIQKQEKNNTNYYIRSLNTKSKEVFREFLNAK